MRKLFRRLASVPVEVEITYEVPPSWQRIDRSTLQPGAAAYLQLKDQYPDSLVLQPTVSGEFYRACFEDAEIIARELDLVLVHKDLGDVAGRSPVLLLPHRSGAMQRFVSHLEQQGYSVVVDEGPTIEVATPKSVATISPTVIEQARGLDLEAVAEQLGLQRDPHDKHKWRDAQHIISINHGQFYDWLADRGSGGAIDLVMHVQDCDFKAAVEWLSGQSLPAVSVQPMAASTRTLELPAVEEDQWGTVRQYLLDTRGLPGNLIDQLHDDGLLYADRQANAVFLRHTLQHDGAVWSRGQPTGASLRGTTTQSFHGLAPGSDRAAGWFWLQQGEGEVKRVVLVESAIDALSLATLEREKLTQLETTVYLSTDGSGAIPVNALQSLVASDGKVLVAFDADQAGEKMAWRVAAEVLGVRRMVPAAGKDWNDRLLAELQPELEPESQPDRQTFKAIVEMVSSGRRARSSRALSQANYSSGTGCGRWTNLIRKSSYGDESGFAKAKTSTTNIAPTAIAESGNYALPPKRESLQAL